VASLPERRPAETGGVAAAVTLLIVRLLGLEDVDTVVALGVVVGFVPAAITWLATLIRPKGSDA
jgi:hypothetical protein